MIKTMLARMRRHLPMYRELLQISDALARVRVDISTIKTIEQIRFATCILEQDSRYRDPRRLQRYALKINSQSGEDGILQEIFRRIETSNRIFAEVGVGDGVENNTVFLLSQGWTGFWFDASDAFLQTINTRRDLQDGCLKWCVSSVYRENIARVFQQLGVPRDFDVLSLDIDQNTYYAWEGLHGFRPRVVVVEYNAALPPDIDWKVHYDPERMWDGTQNFGASLKALERLGRTLGYSLVGCDLAGTNAFFVRDDLVADKFADPFTAENHYEPQWYMYRALQTPAILDRQHIS